MKNIVVFSDGTGQEGGEGANTNVYRLFNMIEDRTVRQIAFYDRGLGTGRRKLSGKAFGSGISQNIQECYEFIFSNFEVGDQIFLFGFSRGAFTVRSLSGFIELVGILPKSRPELIPDAYDIYRIEDTEERKSKADAFLLQHHTMWTRIRCIGVWDTVGALGVPNRVLDAVNPFKNKFHDTRFCEGVDAGFHALSIDDERRSFHPTVWDEDSVDANKQRVEQVWFPGVHTDVGGGYPDTGLPDITLDWMIARATGYGLHIYPRHNIDLSPDPDGVMHDPRGGWGRVYRRKQRSVPEGLKAVQVHESVMQRGLDQTNEPTGYAPWIKDLQPQVVKT